MSSERKFHVVQGSPTGASLGSQDSNAFRLIESIRSCDMDLAIFLIHRGFDVRIADAHGMTALHHAALRGMREVVRELVRVGRCDYSAKDEDGRYPYDLAIVGARDYVLARLLQKKLVQQKASESAASQVGF